MSKSKSIKRVVAQRAARSSEREDRENPPLSAAVLSSMKRVAPIKRIRWQLGLSQEEFADRFEIPIGTLRDWEQGRSQPDRPAQAYLKVIQSQPSAVGRALRPSHKTSASISTLASKALRDPRSLTREDIKNLAASVLTSIGEPVERKRKTR